MFLHEMIVVVADEFRLDLGDILSQVFVIEYDGFLVGPDTGEVIRNAQRTLWRLFQEYAQLPLVCVGGIKVDVGQMVRIAIFQELDQPGPVRKGGRTGLVGQIVSLQGGMFFNRVDPFAKFRFLGRVIQGGKTDEGTIQKYLDADLPGRVEEFDGGGRGIQR